MLSHALFEARNYSATIVTRTSAVTSWCNWIAMLNSPVWRSAPFGRRTSARSTSRPAFVNASAMSRVPIEPNSLPSSPAFAVITMLTSSNWLARAWAAAKTSASACKRTKTSLPFFFCWAISSFCFTVSK